jgi:hypothetical protein
MFAGRHEQVETEVVHLVVARYIHRYGFLGWKFPDADHNVAQSALGLPRQFLGDE